MAEPLKAKEGSLFVQVNAGEAPEYVACVDVDPIPDPRGGITLIRCRDANGNFTTIGEIQTPPDTVSTIINALTYADADILDTLADRNCRANLFVTLRDCGKAGQFNNWVRASVLHHARLINFTGSNMVMREAGEAAMRALEFAGWGVYQLRNRLRLSRVTIAETANLNAIAFDTDINCGGDCGEATELGDTGLLAAGSPAGSPTAAADVWHTSDGLTWASPTGGAANPFAADHDVVGAAIFAVDRSTKRRLVVRMSVGGSPLRIAYSDDAGETWATVTVGSTNAESIASAKGLFVLDRDHLWLATDAGNVYFSDDGGLTWDDQASALAASGGADLNAISFIDADNGYAVGAAGLILRTQDGGETWEAIDGPTSVTDDFTAVTVFSPYRILIGSDADGLYHTSDTGAHWSAKTFTGQVGTGTVRALANVGDLVVFMIHNPVTGQGYVHRSIDGGHSWERLATPVNAGFNDLVALNVNFAYAVGSVQGGTGVIVKVTG